ncbi:homogentisate 1,2-dioxygenase [Aneurinibacillus aneurinilyticus]|jgi:homogentisate 1,2-dioxygenase|uniref:Homogentisate 1,2-dioxygenase n=2 Tax=Aneurinibacillus aneurinilyticus TaxID=1391 RepID=A0A848CYZ4_ANEAE|nr:homogentisate 1,2-dioxygenase [Aneurinibacillus aneurinilyticus]ERI06737.1 homogentisate 1,2-dioxygenase [Aneurinibacillus aneurinilyticus ATCC 12856]MCI1695173.1 homogentisate 1,2-dioxygenase [Aneurinibacillus aneurinilyticus]MED0671632.1 homogentisate 1,2-dioxygenase [Aneurinibacillus aneurinilyticus]MED0704972.1 homogentisate 1,2-dioxygenase [Aneurinibacillus aneurinilyticus]MED0721575.1 homogentisate 1,2-dioxygenase [Aneurinibacillus aneurinilyticus]
MPHYVKMGNIPHKRHTQFRKPDGGLYYEQLMGTKGFSGIQSLIYHINPPTQVTKATKIKDIRLEFEDKAALAHRHFRTWNTEPGGDFYEARKIMLANEDLSIGVARPNKQMPYYYRNGEGDEMLYVHEGKGKIESIFGELSFHSGDYIIIPIGTTYRVVLETEEARFLVVESNSAIVPPKRYRNEHGQLLEHSPYCERDFRTPEKIEAKDEKGEFEVRVRAQGMLTSYLFDFHPLDAVGWDGYLYPYAFSIHDFEPITGRVHQPPPVHQTFEAWNYVVCSFVPRLYDYHPEAIPAPYVHSNVESDEVLYYADGDFMSRRGIEEGSITLHPSGLPHGPHPGKMEESIGKKDTKELAVMIDTFRPLRVVKQAHDYEDKSYMYSWLPQK